MFTALFAITGILIGIITGLPTALVLSRKWDFAFDGDMKTIGAIGGAVIGVILSGGLASDLGIAGGVIGLLASATAVPTAGALLYLSVRGIGRGIGAVSGIGERCGKAAHAALETFNTNVKQIEDKSNDRRE
jgi:hypothetical protein